jgi:hypothetical protein
MYAKSQSGGGEEQFPFQIVEQNLEQQHKIAETNKNQSMHL